MDKQNQCDDCLYLTYDEETDEDFCSLNLDQDDLAKMSYDRKARCPYFRLGDDYTIVRKQGI